MKKRLKRKIKYLKTQSKPILKNYDVDYEIDKYQEKEIEKRRRK